MERYVIFRREIKKKGTERGYGPERRGGPMAKHCEHTEIYKKVTRRGFAMAPVAGATR